MDRSLEVPARWLVVVLCAFFTVFSGGSLFVFGLLRDLWWATVAIFEAFVLGVIGTVGNISLLRKARRGEPPVWGVVMQWVFLMYCVLTGWSMFVMGPLMVVDLAAHYASTDVLIIAAVSAIIFAAGGVLLIAVGIWAFRRTRQQ